MLLLDDSLPAALVVDKTLPASSARLHQMLVEAWPRLSGRIAFTTDSVEAIEILDTDIVVSSHACGVLTDVILSRAAAAMHGSPCCPAVEAWAEIHREELQRDWELLQSGQPPVKIEPLR